MNTFRRSGLVVLGVALTGLVLLLAFAATTRVFAPPPTPLPTPPPPPPAMQQTVDSTTLTIQPIYADASRIVLTGTVTVLDGPGQDLIWGFGSHSLRTTEGDSLREMPEDRWAVDGQLLWNYSSRSVPPRGPLGLTFDAAPVAQQGDLDLHLQVSLAGCSGAVDCRPWTLVGPFTYRLHMPVDPLRRVAVVQQTLQGYKTALTLDRVIATRHETRMDFRYDDGIPWPANLPPREMPFAFQGVQALQAGDRTLSFGRIDVDQVMNAFTDSVTLSLLTSTLTLPDRWMLTLNPWPNNTDRGGPWVFHFPMAAVGVPPLVLTPVVLPPLPPPPTATPVPFVSPIPTVPPLVPPPIPSWAVTLPTPVRSTGPPPGPALTATAVAPRASPTK